MRWLKKGTPKTNRVKQFGFKSEGDLKLTSLGG